MEVFETHLREGLDHTPQHVNVCTNVYTCCISVTRCHQHFWVVLYEGKWKQMETPPAASRLGSQQLKWQEDMTKFLNQSLANWKVLRFPLKEPRFERRVCLTIREQHRTTVHWGLFGNKYCWDCSLCGKKTCGSFPSTLSDLNPGRPEQLQ